MNAHEKPSGVTARKLARQKMAAMREAQRQRDEQNTADLEAFYMQQRKIQAAAAKRDATIAAAHTTYDNAVRDALDAQSHTLRAINQRGTTHTDLAEIADLPLPELRKLLKRTARASKTSPHKTKPPKAE